MFSMTGFQSPEREVEMVSSILIARNSEEGQGKNRGPQAKTGI